MVEMKALVYDEMRVNMFRSIIMRWIMRQQNDIVFSKMEKNRIELIVTITYVAVWYTTFCGILRDKYGYMDKC